VQAGTAERASKGWATAGLDPIRLGFGVHPPAKKVSAAGVFLSHPPDGRKMRGGRRRAGGRRSFHATRRRRGQGAAHPRLTRLRT
jgi:hypothetical protein